MSVLSGHAKAFAALAAAFADHSREVMDDAGRETDPRIAALLAERAMLLSSFSMVHAKACDALHRQMLDETTGTDNRVQP